MATGNAVIVKPAPESPLTLLHLAELAIESGLPKGLLNVVPGDGIRTGAALIEDPRIGEITFTGSVETGISVGKTAMDTMTPTSLELGGKSPALVFEDCDVDAAVEGAYNALTLISGQVCFATTRIFIHEDIYSRFRESLLDKIDEVSIGPGMEDPDIGPLISRESIERVKGYVDQAVSEGANVISGGAALNSEGYFFEPTIIEGAEDDAAISCEEVFGPVINLYRFSEESEVIQRANDSRYGLYATVWTNKLDRAHRVVKELEAGSVMVNQYFGSHPQTPFGGYNMSGLGRGKGLQALDHYTQTKTTNISFDVMES